MHVVTLTTRQTSTWYLDWRFRQDLRRDVRDEAADASERHVEILDDNGIVLDAFDLDA